MPQRPPRRKPSVWTRFKWWLYTLQSPLQLRRSLIRLRHQHKYPLLTLLGMFIPYPSWKLPVPGPFSLRALIDDEKNRTGIILSHFADLHNLRAIRIFRMRDTPLRSVYRIYELFMADQYPLMGWETEYFVFSQPKWRLQDIPDPRDPDPLRYAMIASIVEELGEAINWRLGLGLRRNGDHLYREEDTDPLPPFIPEQLPDWTKKVLPMDKGLLKSSVPAGKIDANGNLVLEENGRSPIFARRNIITNTGWFYTI